MNIQKETNQSGFKLPSSYRKQSTTTFAEVMGVWVTVASYVSSVRGAVTLYTKQKQGDGVIFISKEEYKETLQKYIKLL